MRRTLMLLSILLAACASNPKGSAKVRAVKGNSASVNYVTVAELEKDLRAKGGENLEVEIRMLPRGGRIFFESTQWKVSAGEQLNTNPFLSILEDGKEIKFCDESDFNSVNTRVGSDFDGTEAAIPLKANTVKLQCDLPRPPSGEFEVRLLDSEKQIVENFFVTPAGAK